MLSTPLSIVRRLSSLAVLALLFDFPFSSFAQAVKLTQVQWHGTGCYRIEMPMGTVYFEKDNGVSGFKSFIDPEGKDWIASYLPPGPNGDYRGFPNSNGNFGHAGRDSKSITRIIDGKTEGDLVILESSNPEFTFQYWFFPEHIAIKVLKSPGDYCFLLECVAGGTADADDYFVTADGKQHLPSGEFADFSPEWFYLGDRRSKHHLFLAKTPDDQAPNENHRQLRKGGVHNMDLYSFGRTGAELKYQIRGMAGNEHVCIIGFTRKDRTHAEIQAFVEGLMRKPFETGSSPVNRAERLIVEAESGRFSGSVDRHSCWHNVMLTDGPHSSHSGSALVDTKNEVGSYVEVDYEATTEGLHRITARYTHTRSDPRPGELFVDGKAVARMELQQTPALPSFRTESVVIPLSPGKHVLRLQALAGGGLPNMDYIKVAELRELAAGVLPRIQVLEVEDGRYSGKLDHHSCWTFIAQTKANHSGFTGEGFVDTENKAGSYVEVALDSPAVGRYEMGVRYVHCKDDERPAEVLVNGATAKTPLLFPRTPWWTEWTYAYMQVDLQEGRNLVRLRATGAEGLANIDHFSFKKVSAVQAPSAGEFEVWGRSYLQHSEGWFSTSEARAVADSVIQYQSRQGGWPKSTDLAQPPRSQEDIPPEGRGRANSLDNDATTLPMQYLARVATATEEPRYRESFLRGVDYLLAAQYSCGGWPQFWPLRGDAYYSRITFNDDAMIRVLFLLREVAAGMPPYAFVDAEHRAKAGAAVQRGIDCILKTQIRQQGHLTAWCAQYDETTMEPAWARKFEPPSLSGNESVGIVSFLLSLENPGPEIVAAIEGAVTWLRSVQLQGLRLEKIRGKDNRLERRLVPDPAAPPLWARFYELGTNRPLYLDRDSVFHYDYMEVGHERRSGYDYHGDWAAELLAKEYPAWRARLP